MNVKNWKLLNIFKKKNEENSILFFPSPEEVFMEKGMEMYFTPLLTYIYKENDKEYKIHLITTAGLICENDYPNSENRFFAFQYINGKYKFIGNLHTFGNSEIKEVYSFLREDFENNKDYYLQKKVSIEDYVKLIKPLAKKAGNFTEGQSLKSYLENFYSYEIEKYNFQKTGKIMQIYEITENIFKENKHWFYNTEETKKLLKNFYSVSEEYLSSKYNFNEIEPVCAADTFHFSSLSATAIAFLDSRKNLVYTFENDK